MIEIVIETLGWIGSVLVVGSYALNLQGKLAASSIEYILANLVGGAFFVVNTYYHKAYPSTLVNVIWIIFAVDSLRKYYLAKKVEK